MAQYCAKYLPDYLKSLDEYKNLNLEESLKKLFLKFDESLLSEKAQKELKDLKEMINTSMKKVNEEDEEEEEEEGDEAKEESGSDEAEEQEDPENEAAQLYDEATMPLEEVLKRYASTESKVKKALRKKGVLKPGPSPMITAARSSSHKHKKKHHEEGEAAAEECKPITAAEFQKQEERDIDEIKKNGTLNEEIGEMINSSDNNHEQDYDEASNLVGFCLGFVEILRFGSLKQKKIFISEVNFFIIFVKEV